jgi:glycosyltransferase involved in cell wall biosynthesis
LVADENVLMEHCAEVTVCSPALAEAKGAVRPVHLIPNGVDLGRYRTPYKRPDALPAGRTAVYVGTVHTDRVDVELCATVARTLRRDKLGSVVLVGPAPLPAAQRQLLDEAGVVLLGARSYWEVPAFLQHADVLLVPHVVDDFTESLDPIKLYEYQAVGKPVVSTPVSGFREHAGRLITVVGGAEFPGAVVDRLTGPALASADDQLPAVPTWDDRVEQMAEVLTSAAGRNRTAG